MVENQRKGFYFRSINFMINKIKKFFERDQDITYYDEFHYIYITLKELIEVIRTRNK
jgi:hypothetical protein